MTANTNCNIMFFNNILLFVNSQYSEITPGRYQPGHDQTCELLFGQAEHGNSLVRSNHSDVAIFMDSLVVNGMRVDTTRTQSPPAMTRRLNRAFSLRHLQSARPAYRRLTGLARARGHIA